MADPLSILAFSGSGRTRSWNTRLLEVVVRDLEATGAAVTRVHLPDYPLPLYDGDLEEAQGVPEAAVTLRRLIAEHRGLLIACPEYNGSVTALLKNTLDWCSRPTAGMGGLAPFQRKPVLIVGTSIGPFGAVRAIGHLRAILSKMGALVTPEDLAVPNAAQAFAEEALADPGTRAAAQRAAQAFADLAFADLAFADLVG